MPMSPQLIFSLGLMVAERKEWVIQDTQLLQQSRVTGRRGHRAVVIGSWMALLGGRDQAGPLGDMHLYDLGTLFCVLTARKTRHTNKIHEQNNINGSPSRWKRREAAQQHDTSML
jgi:hypothetical protein